MREKRLMTYNAAVANLSPEQEQASLDIWINVRE